MLLFGLMKILAYIYYWTWFLWPFVFIFSFAVGIKEVVKDEEKQGGNLALAAVALLIMLAGLLYPGVQ